MVKLYLLLICALFLFACREIKPGKPEQVEKKITLIEKKIDLKFVEIYEGNVPCADCLGTFLRLVLKRETEKTKTGVFRLTENFKGKASQEDGISEVITTGEFKFFVDEKNRNRLEIADPNFADTSARIREFFVEKNELAQFRDDRSQMNLKLYRLKKIRTLKCKLVKEKYND